MELLVSSKRQRARLAVKDWFVKKMGWLAETLGVPALLKHFEFVDPETDMTIYLYTSDLYTVLCVGDRRFYFNRLSGKLDGESSLPALTDAKKWKKQYGQARGTVHEYFE